MSELLASRYRIEERLGSGQQGSVFRAHDTVLDRLVALKMIHGTNDAAGLGESLQREAKLLAKFENPNVVRVYDVITDDRGQPVIVMELLDGESLSKCIRTLSKSEVFTFVQQICEAMHDAHLAGLLHRDLKPGNIMLLGRNTPRTRFVILDMGIGKFTAPTKSSEASSEQTFAGAGTPMYMAPEQCNGASGDARTDIYAFGSILYEVYARAAPFAHHGENLMQLIAAVAQDTPQSLPLRYTCHPVSMRLDQLILKCLEKHPDERPQTMKEVLTLFAAAHDEAPTDESFFDTDALETIGPPRVKPVPLQINTDTQLPPEPGSPARKATTHSTANPAKTPDTPKDDGLVGNAGRVVVAGVALLLLGIGGFLGYEHGMGGRSSNDDDQIPPLEKKPPVPAIAKLDSGSSANGQQPDTEVDIRNASSGQESKIFEPATNSKPPKIPPLTATEKLTKEVEAHGGQILTVDDQGVDLRIHKINIPIDQLTSALVGELFNTIEASQRGYIVSSAEMELALLQSIPDGDQRLLQLDLSNAGDRTDRAMSMFTLPDRLGAFVANYNMEFADAHLKTLLERQTRLQHLTISDSNIGTSVPTVDPASLKLLRVLNLDFNKINGAYVANLLKHTALEELSLGDTGVDDETVALISFSNLRVLNLTNTAVTNIGAATICARGSATLEKLLLAATLIDDDAMDSLAKLQKLKQLNVGDRLSPEGVLRLRGLLPGVEIITE